MIITPEYYVGRPNIHFNIFLILYLGLIIQGVNNKEFLMPIKIITIICFLLVCTNDVRTYKYIGQVKQERIKSIKAYIEKKSDYIECKMIKPRMLRYIEDGNLVCQKEYWAHKDYLLYFSIPETARIIMVD